MNRFIQIPLSTVDGKIRVVDGIVNITVTIKSVDYKLPISVSDEMREDQLTLAAYLHDYADRHDFSKAG